MKGIAHFVTGVAVATFFPEIVYGAAQHLSFGPVLGGLAGLLPDTLDFKFSRYFQHLDDEIDPAEITSASGLPDPQAIAERIAAAMARAGDRAVRIQLHTVRLGADLWRRWTVAFDLEQNQVVVGLGPAVTTAGVAYAASEIPGLAEGRATVGSPILHTYDTEIEIDVFSGPSLAFEREAGRGPIKVTFLDWHRAWSHSLLMVLLLGMAGWLLSPAYGLAMALAALAHIVQDQMGYMGSNLFFPLTSQRTRGLRWFRSGDALPNLWTVWLGLAVILFNLDRFSPEPVIPVWPYLLGAVALPSALFLVAYLGGRARDRRKPAVVLEAVEALDETDQPDL